MANLTYKQAVQVAPAATTTKGAFLTAAEIDGNMKSLNDDIQTRVSRAGDTLTGPLNWAGIPTVASAATTSIGTATSNTLYVSGVVPITSFGIGSAGMERTLTFISAVTITHHATSLILPYGVDITTAAGDTATFLCLSTGNWRCISYSRNLDILAAGTTSQYYRGDKTWRDLATDVRGSVLTGLSTTLGTLVTASHTVLEAIGFLQKQITLKQDTLVSATNIKTIDGNSLLGSGNVQINFATVTTPPDGTRLSTDTQYILDGSSTSGFVYLLPNAIVGKRIRFIDMQGNWDTGPWYVGYDVTGGKVMGLTENMLVDRANFNFELVYTGTTGGWRIV